jgi:phosphatidylserine/phosphatidylglycerophosphate/cardiolipin synthase-like enzyme
LGDVLTSAAPVSWTVTGLVDVQFTGTMTNLVQAGTSTFEPVMGNNSAEATTLVAPPPPILLINGVLYDGYQLDDYDEAMQIVNVGPAPANLQAWKLGKNGSPSSAVFPAYTLAVNQRVWASKDAGKFHDSFGFWPDFAMQGTLSNSTALALTGAWVVLSNTGDEVQLKDPLGAVADRLAYGSVTPSGGWSGPTVTPYSVGRSEGQILARVPDEATGLPIPDTDTAADWIQSTASYTTGRRVMYPGWDMTFPVTEMARLFWPLAATTTPATVTLGVAPDHAFEVTRDAIRSAQHSIEIEAYELTNYGLITEVVQHARAGVSVTLLLEGGPVGGLSDQERWACQEIEWAGGQCWFMFTRDAERIHSRYDYIHAKTIILDRQRLIVSTQNLSGGGMPDDDKTDGTYGSRGYVLHIESPELAARAGLIYDRDRNTAHADITRWSPTHPDGFGLPPSGYVPVTTSGGTTTTVLFPAPAVFTDATQFELFTAPEAALRQSDALLGLLARAGAGDEVTVEQLYEYPNWGDAPNVRLDAYIRAARRGATVRILLNSGSFDVYADIDKNITTTDQINALARAQGLDLQARVGNPTRYGIHSKLVLVKLNGAGLAYSHVGSINGSEASSKVNRELAVQVESKNLYAALARVLAADWNLSAPIFMPLVMRNYKAPDHLLISEVLYDPSGNPDTGREWIEVYNPMGAAIDISGWSLGDAVNDGEYGAGRYLFPPNTLLPPGGVLVIAQQAADVAFKPGFEFLIDPNRDDPTVPNMLPAGGWVGFGLALGNTGDHVILRDATGQIVDVIVWGDSSYPGALPHPGVLASDHSLERRPAPHDTDDCAADFFDRTPPTPGTVPQ